MNKKNSTDQKIPPHFSLKIYEKLLGYSICLCNCNTQKINLQNPDCFNCFYSHIFSNFINKFTNHFLLLKYQSHKQGFSRVIFPLAFNAILNLYSF